ncbi:uncharacterized protein [Porites lutea]|uniref:uncharacterized protein isoform X1 n=1 Tax=Porites lutea TaxID=51062 RepID=UPI003CC66F65
MSSNFEFLDSISFPRHDCNMNSELRKSAGSDIKRLQEMVKRLEEQNAQLKSSDYSLNRRTPNNRVMGDEATMVKVKLNLDDVPLLDLNAAVEEDDDTWLYVSPSHPPSAEQKRISPYRYLKDSLDIPELNKVRGSLLAKLESIAAQEEALSGSPPSESQHHHHRHPDHSRTDESSHRKTSMQMTDNIQGDDSELKQQRHVPSPTAVSQDDSDLVVKGPLRRRGGPSKPATSLHKNPEIMNGDSDDGSDDDNNTLRPQRRVPATLNFHSTNQDDSSLVVKGPVKRRGPSPKTRASFDAVTSVDGYYDDSGFVHQERPQRQVPVPQEFEDLVVKGPLKRRGGTPQQRQPVATGLHHSAGLMNENNDDDDSDNDNYMQRPLQRRVPVAAAAAASGPSLDDSNLVVKGPLKRRGGTPQLGQPVASGPVKRRESPQLRASVDEVSYMDEYDSNNGFVPQERPQKLDPVPSVPQENADLVVKGPLKRRGGTPRPRQPVATGYGLVENDDEEYVQPRRRGASPASSQNDHNSSWKRDDPNSDANIPVVTAVKRREPNQVKRREPARPRTAEDSEMRRRSLPQAPTYSRSGPNSRQSNTPPQAPASRKSVTPRTGQLAAPRRIPTPRGLSPGRTNNDDSWSEGCY